MKRESIKQWFSKVFIRDINIPKKTFLYLFFSLLAIMLIVEALIFNYIKMVRDVGTLSVEGYIFVFTVAISFFISGILVDFIKNRTRYYNLTLLVCIIGLLMSAISNKIFNYLNSGRKVRKLKNLDNYVSFINGIARFSTTLNLSPFPFNKIVERHNGKGNFFVKIGEGCVGNCSYCIIKKAKNRIISRKIEDILLDIKNNIDEQKEKNIVLIADDCGSYGIDIGTNIIELLFQIGNHFPSLGIDIYYLYPKWIEKMGNKLLNIFKQVNINSINIPIQSGSLKVLKSMNRSYDLERIFQFINMLKKISPETMVFTHYLVGFPGESFKDFLKTISTIPYFHNFYPFAYSSRKGTKSNEFPNEIPNIMKRIRVTIILIMLYMNFARIILRNIIRRRK